MFCLLVHSFTKRQAMNVFRSIFAVVGTFLSTKDNDATGRGQRVSKIYLSSLTH